MVTTRMERATSFGAWADEYHAFRPSYPLAAVEWLLADACRVVEVGAGTGKLTDRLVEFDDVSLDVTEIDGRMLRVISERHPALRVHERGATDLPIGDAAVDAVEVADAWHWFPKQEAAAEFARVLRPSGWVGIVWNDPADTTPDWQWDAVRLDAGIAARARSMAPLDRLGVTAGEVDQQKFRWSWTLTPAQWRGYVATVSHVRTLPPRERRDVLAATERFASEACAAAGTSAVALEFDAVCIRWRPAM